MAKSTAWWTKLSVEQQRLWLLLTERENKQQEYFGALEGDPLELMILRDEIEELDEAIGSLLVAEEYQTTLEEVA